MSKVAIIYHYLASYRLPIFQELMNSENVEYHIYSGLDSEINIKKIDEKFAEISVDEGGLRWTILKNSWLLGKRFLWQHGLFKMILFGRHNSYIFLGSPYHLSTWVASVLARIKGKKVYFWMHGVYKEKITGVDYIKLYLFYKIANGYFLYGNRAAKILEQRKVSSPDKIHVVYNSLDHEECLKYRREIDMEDILKFRESYFKDTKTPIVCFIGRLNSTKKIELLIEAQKILKDKLSYPAFNIILIGDGEAKGNLKELVLKYDLTNHIIFKGAIYEERNISHILLNSDLCVNPGEVGLTAIHAMSYGTPVISHNNFNIQMPEVEAIKIGETGDFYVYDNLDNLVKTLKQWFILYPIKNKTIIENCISTIDQYYNPEYQRKIFDSSLTR